MVQGYKAYKKGLINQLGEKHEIGQVYSIPGFSHSNEGLCFSRNIEDTLRYYNGLEEELDIALVEGIGEIHEFYDDYYETTSLAPAGLRPLRVLSRTEIIDYALRLDEARMCKMIAGYRFNDGELILFEDKGEKVNDYIDFYQRGDRGAFTKRFNVGRI